MSTQTYPDRESPTYLICDPCPPNFTGYKVGTVLTFLLTEAQGQYPNEFILTEAGTDPYSLEQLTTR